MEVLVGSAVTAQYSPYIAVAILDTSLQFCDHAAINELAHRRTSRDLFHVGVAHGRGFYGRYMSFVLLNLGSKCQSQPRRIIFRDKSQSGEG